MNQGKDSWNQGPQLLSTDSRKDLVTSNMKSNVEVRDLDLSYSNREDPKSENSLNLEVSTLQVLQPKASNMSTEPAKLAGTKRHREEVHGTAKKWQSEDLFAWDRLHLEETLGDERCFRSEDAVGGHRPKTRDSAPSDDETEERPARKRIETSVRHLATKQIRDKESDSRSTTITTTPADKCTTKYDLSMVNPTLVSPKSSGGDVEENIATIEENDPVQKLSPLPSTVSDLGDQGMGATNTLLPLSDTWPSDRNNSTRESQETAEWESERNTSPTTTREEPYSSSGPAQVSPDNPADLFQLRQGELSEFDTDNESSVLEFTPFMPVPTVFPYPIFTGMSGCGWRSQSSSTIATMPSAFPSVDWNPVEVSYATDGPLPLRLAPPKSEEASSSSIGVEKLGTLQLQNRGSSA